MFEENEEFEFVSICKAEDDVVVLDGQIGLVFPVFNREFSRITDDQDLKNREREEEGEEEEEDEDVRCQF